MKELDLPRSLGFRPDLADEFNAAVDELIDQFEGQLSDWGWDPTRPLDYNDDTLLTLEQAVCLPEFGGQLFREVKVSIPGPHVSVKTLRAAIADGGLQTIRLNRNIRVTRRLIQEWIACPVPQNLPISSGLSQSTTKKQANSSQTAIGQSKTVSGSSAQDAAMKLVQKLKKND